MITIVQSTAIVAGSGVEASTVQVQDGGPAELSYILQYEGINNYNVIDQFGDISQEDNIIQFQGISQTAHIVNPTIAESTAGVKFVIFPNTFSRGVFLAGVMGVTGTVEKFFDRSPFFFTPSETDPNTLRDISEAQQFLIFSNATITSFDPYTHTSRVVNLVQEDGASGPTHIYSGLPTLSGVPFTLSESDSVTQVDQSPPYFDETSPASGTRNVPADSTVGFHVKDISSALNMGSINIYIDSDQVVSAGYTVSGTTWPISDQYILASNDVQYTFTRGDVFSPGITVTVSGEFADMAAISNSAEDFYQFTIVGSGSLDATISGAPDTTSPVITPTDPEDLDTGISPNTEIQWSLTDDASGVDLSTVKLLLNGATVLENDIALTGSFSRVSNSSRGYDYSYLPATAFEFGSTVTGSIIAADNDGNSGSLSYEFTITSDDTLEIRNFFLGLGQSVPLTTGTLMSVEVVDYTYGVVSGTTTFMVNGVVPSGLLTTYSGSGMLFSVPVEPLVDFREDLTVVVHAENNFPGDFPVVVENQYTLQTGYGVQWPNKAEDAAGGPEEIFPYLTNIQVLADVKNFAINYGEASTFTRFLVEEQAKKDLGAIIISNVKTADMPAVLTSVNPFFEYGKTMVLEIEADDLEGNQFRLTHTFVIETE